VLLKRIKKKKKKEAKAPPSLISITDPEKREAAEKIEAEKPKPMDTTK